MAKLIECGKQSPADPQKGVSATELIFVLGILALVAMAMTKLLHTDPTMLYRTVLGWL